MALPFRLGGPASKDFAIFGKLPGRADFLRVNASLPVCQELDESLQAALGEVARSPGWQEHFDGLPIVDVFWASERSGTAFLGSAVPSQDASGRRFPLLAGLVLELQEARKIGPLLPLAGELLLNQIRLFLRQAISSRPEVNTLIDYLKFQASGKGHDFLDPDLTQDIHLQFLAGEPWWEIGRAFSPEAPEQALQTALLHLLFHTHATPRGMDLAQRSASLPLLAEPGRTTLHQVCWLDILLHLSAAPGRSWDRQWLVRQYPLKLRLLAHPSGASGREFAGMLLDDPAPDLQLNLQAGTRPWHHHPLFPEISYRFDRFRKTRGSSMMDLLSFLKETSRQFTSPNR
jgi:type VI secretion system protein ImpM